jgi:hypothetical protein
MARIYVDRRLLTVRSANGWTHDVPGAAEALAHLADAGHEVEVVDGVPEIGGLKPGAEPASADTWLLTSDRSDCRIARHHGLRTMLVGPHTVTRRPTERCDEEVRDLTVAALGILAVDAMGDR